MTIFQAKIDQLLQKRGKMIIGVVGYQYGGHDAQLHDTDYFVCDAEDINSYDFGYYASPREFNMRELIFLLLGGMIRETSGYSHPGWNEVYHRTPSL